MAQDTEWYWYAGGVGVAAFALWKLYGGSSMGSSLFVPSEPLASAPSGSAAAGYLSIINGLASEFGISPKLIYAIVEMESGWGKYLSPQGPGGTGDSGHGHGLGQIDDRYHSTFLNSYDWRDPETNLRYALKNVLMKYRSELIAKGLTGQILDQANIVSYNAGVGNTMKGISEGDVEKYSTHQVDQWGDKAKHGYLWWVNSKLKKVGASV